MDVVPELRRSNFFLKKSTKVKGHQCPDYYWCYSGWDYTCKFIFSGCPKNSSLLNSSLVNPPPPHQGLI